MNRRKFIKTISFLAALPFLPKVVTKRLDSVVIKSEWGRLLAPDLREVYLETGKERPLEYPVFKTQYLRDPERDKAMANILNNAFTTPYIKKEND